jgi:hypothetical protein
MLSKVLRGFLLPMYFKKYFFNREFLYALLFDLLGFLDALYVDRYSLFLKFYQVFFVAFHHQKALGSNSSSSSSHTAYKNVRFKNRDVIQRLAPEPDFIIKEEEDFKVLTRPSYS